LTSIAPDGSLHARELWHQSQIKNNPSRSIEAIEALARFRGSQNGCKYAEGFKLIRAIV
jgi:hypothetical protein